ncbi:MAG: hypothetical protein IPP66_06455 [Anaerolineales bacterium]|nr:hypothetical protein [Anaerolineales bacterium]
MSSFQITFPSPGESFSIDSVIEANGNHSLEIDSFIWAVLRDTYGHYYLQNPPVSMKPDGNWHAKNIHLGEEIIEITFVKATTTGNEHFLRKVENHDWGGFDEFPLGTEQIGSVSINVN